MADLNPAGRRLAVGNGRVSNGGQHPASAVIERRDRTQTSARVGIGHIELSWVGGPEVGADRAETLRRERRTHRGHQSAKASYREAVDQRGGVPGADHTVTGGVEKHIAHAGSLGYRDPRVRQWNQLTSRGQVEAAVVASAGTDIGDVYKSEAVHGDAHRLDTPGGDRRADRTRNTVPADPQYRDLITAGIHREQEAAVGAGLQGALRAEAGTEPDTTGRER